MMETNFLPEIGLAVLVLNLILVLFVYKLKKQLMNLNKFLNAEFKKVNHYLAVLAKNEGERIIPDFKIYVGNVDYSTTEDELRQVFAHYGPVAEVNIPRDRRSGRPRGYGFITFADPAHAVNALELDGSNFKERTIQVNFAKERN